MLLKLWPAALLLGTMSVGAHASSLLDRYYAIYIDGKRVGYSHLLQAQTPEGRKTVTDSRINVSLLGAPGEQTVQGISLYTPDGSRPIRYSVTSHYGTTSPTTLDYRFSDGKVVMTANIPGQPATKTVPWTHDCYFLSEDLDSEGARLVSALGPKSRSCMVRYLDGSDRSIKTVPLTHDKTETISVLGRPHRCDVYTLDRGQTAMQFAISRDTHQVVEYSYPAHKITCRLTDRTAMKGLGNYDALSHAFAMTDVTFPDPNSLTYLKIRVHGQIVAEKITVASLQSPTQTFSGTVKDGVIDGIFEIRPFHYDGSHAPPFTSTPSADLTLAGYLKPETNVESNDSEIVSLAREITAGSQTQWEAVQRIGDWMRSNIRYTLTGSGAKQCLLSKTGDCGPHTWLTMALCRAAGIPARMTGGALYSGAFGGSFGQHYWTRVWMGSDGWVPIDTTTGEIGSLSPTHLTFWQMGGIGSLSVKVLDYAPKPSPSAFEPGPQRHPFRVRAGEKERYVFTANGKKIGEQTAECVYATGPDVQGVAASRWKYAIQLTVGPAREMNGTFTITDTAAPLNLTLNVIANNNTTTKVVCTFGSNKVHSAISGAATLSRDTTLKGGEFFTVNNLITGWSLTMRALRIAPGQQVNVPLFAVNTLQPLNVTLAAQPHTETIQVGGKKVECVVCDGGPLGRFYLDRATGGLVRLAVDAQKLVIDRQ